MKEVIIVALLVPVAAPSQGGRDAWTNIGPTPAAIEAVAVDPRGTGTMFLGAISGGVRKSVNGGSTWSAINTGLGTAAVQALALDVLDPQTLYAATSGGLYKTSDGGETWRNLSAISGAITCVTADPNRSGVVYAGAFNNLANGSIRKSTDGGLTWTAIFPTTAAIFNIVIDPQNTDILYAPTIGHGTFKSSDGGQSWFPLSALGPAAVWTIAVDRGNSQTLYAGTNEDGVWKSLDGGDTWRPTGLSGDFPVYSLTIDPSDSQTMYAGTNGGGVWMSGNGGAMWQPTSLANGMVFSMAVDAAGSLYVGTNGAGAQVSDDHGLTWRVLNAGLDGVNKFGYGVWIAPNGGQTIFVGSELGYGLVRSEDGGVSWSDAGQGFTAYGSRSVAFDPSDSQRVYAGGMVGNAFLKSSDGGRTWSRRFFGSPAVYVISVGVDPLSPNIVYAGTQNEGLFKSTDYGNTWATAGPGLTGAITYLTPDPTKSGRLFVSTANAVFLTEDGGKTWNNAMNTPAWTVTFDGNNASTVYATTRTQGVFRSSDGGHTWQPINAGITNLTMGNSAPVIIDPANPLTLYVGSAGAGVFKSLDGGSHWFAINSGLDDLRVVGLAMDPSNPGVLYACGPSGVYKTSSGGGK